MKQKYLIFVLVIGLLAFTACTSNYYPNEENNSSESNENNQIMEIEDNQTTLVSGDYQINSADSKMTWYGYRLVGNNHRGVIDIKSGSLQVIDGQLSGGEFVIDMASLKSDDDIEALENHLKGEDFFNIAQYPEAKLVITNVLPVAESGSYQVEADLSIKDVTAPINFMAQLSQTANTLEANTELSIDRTIWNLQYGSGNFFQDLGDKVISDDIDFTVDLKANLVN